MSSSESDMWSTGAMIFFVQDPNGTFTSHPCDEVFTQYRKQFWNTTPGAYVTPCLVAGTVESDRLCHHVLQLLSLNLCTAQLLRFNANTVSPALTRWQFDSTDASETF